MKRIDQLGAVQDDKKEVWETPRIILAGHVTEIVGDGSTYGSPSGDDDDDDEYGDDDD